MVHAKTFQLSPGTCLMYCPYSVASALTRCYAMVFTLDIYAGYFIHTTSYVITGDMLITMTGFLLSTFDPILTG